jgi:hypothetical protein
LDFYDAIWNMDNLPACWSAYHIAGNRWAIVTNDDDDAPAHTVGIISPADALFYRTKQNAPPERKSNWNIKWKT